jgi:hypothetical protein
MKNFYFLLIFAWSENNLKAQYTLKLIGRR